MKEVYISSSGKAQQYVNGRLVNDIKYSGNYDGSDADLYLKHNDQQYYTQLDNASLIELLEYPKDS